MIDVGLSIPGVEVRGFGGGFDPNWYKKFQWGGTNPSVVMDFVNGLYWDGTKTSALPSPPSALLTNGQVAAGGLDCTSANANAANMTAAGALLTAFQGGKWLVNFGLTSYTAQGSGFNCYACAASNASTPTDQYLIMSGGKDECFTNAGGHGLGPTAAVTPTSSFSQHGASTDTVGVTRAFSLCGTGIGAGNANDAFPFASNPTIVFIGGLSTGFPGDTLNGLLAHLAVVNGQAPTTRLFAVPAFAGTNGWYYNASTAANIGYGNVLQYEFTQPWTAIAAIKLVAGTVGAATAVNGIIFSNVDATPFPGYEFWIGGLNQIFVRVIHDFGNGIYVGKYGSTNLVDEQWHIVAATYDGSGLAAGVNLYVDGVLETMTVEKDTLAGNSIIGAAGNNSYMIGNQFAATPANALQGIIGLFRQFNRVLSLGEIQSFTTGIFTANKIVPSLSGVVLAPALSEGGASTTTADLSASGFTGTFNSTNNWLRG